ncbi:alpha-L-fucosidase [Streptomyces sp. CB01249]|uniref:alpha-L-fucosidase n=1 Tax=Streptomyces sp. CB01249 TaxID=1703929 RepID=UPI00093D99B0|nr:alpha-L-fucosidase [Streptomyces sp. CB01249]OKJ00141.1 alpha-L-fucosidase [Streptomyces sp. CB01249]
MARRTHVLSALALAAAAALIPVTATAQQAAPGPSAAAGACRGPVKPASQMAVEDCDSPARIIEKAANIVPTTGQLAWQQREVTAFTHFGMNTFTGREWGSGTEDEKLFAPAAIDSDQWMRAYKAAGAEQVMLTVKHHDGFVLYPSRYTDHSVALSPGSPDVVAAYVKAARKAGLKVGFYLSPSDGAELPHAWHAEWVEKIRAKEAAGQSLSLPERMALEDGDRAPAGQGRFGNGSPVTARTIPTLVPGDDRAARVKSGRLPSFQVRADDYDAYYLNQLYEIFTQYGPVEELWLDGANPWSGSGITQKYDVKQWFDMVKALSPDTVVFQGPQGVRWVGNENGTARETEWSVTPHTTDPWTGLGSLPNDSTDPDIGSRARLLEPETNYLQWYPAEADVSNRPGWFYHENEQPKTAAQLMDLYEKSVGRNASLLLNVPPAPDGRIAAEDVTQLTAFGADVRRIYGTDVRQQRPGPYTFDRVAVREDIRHGQRVEKFAVEARVNGAWQRIAEGTTIGHERILTLPEAVTATAVRVKVLESRAKPHLGATTLHLTSR